MKDLHLDLILGTDFMRQNAVVLDYNENKIALSKKGLHAPLVSHMPACTEQKLASAVMTYFEDRVCRNENHLVAGNLALFSMPEKQWKVGNLDVNKEFSVCQRDKLRAVLSEYFDRFAFEKSQLGKYSGLEVKIKTQDEIPVHKLPYRVSMGQREIIEKQVQQMLDS
ncbi:hypothetical protein EVAR_66375_1 [Eumeta japonica]|uniref:Uncharacterized protein n=1 Tax=Eumeta variegata TaxID=151549 RepID=A0A4C1ZHB7_EUMVA|nr:hypothetical protein EVAR_66375_1 [Eumeta japonica]